MVTFLILRHGRWGRHGWGGWPPKPIPGLIEGEYRFSDKNMRQRKRYNAHPLPFDPDERAWPCLLLGANAKRSL
jgi:hypothetical protein